MDSGNIAAVLKRKGEFQLENKQVPEPKSHEVLIAIHTVGICGTDVHIWKEGSIGKSKHDKPSVLGHESSGVVVKVGDDVKHLKPGDRVCIEPSRPCGKCQFCREGRYNLCPIVFYNYSGTLCQYYCHDADFCYK